MKKKIDIFGDDLKKLLKNQDLAAKLLFLIAFAIL